MSLTNICAVVGVGPGIGAAVASKFAKEGYSVALIARNKEKLDAIATKISKFNTKILSVPADATDPVQVKAAFNKIQAELGPVNVLIYNSGAFTKPSSVLDITIEQFELSWKTNCVGALLCSQQVLPSMVNNKQGTIIITGATASLRGGNNFASFASAKFALRALAQSMARELGPKGIHVSHVIVDGQVESEASTKAMPQRPVDSYLSPDAIADSYYFLHSQDKTSWTQELDLRPYVEKF